MIPSPLFFFPCDCGRAAVCPQPLPAPPNYPNPQPFLYPLSPPSHVSAQTTQPWVSPGSVYYQHRRARGWQRRSWRRRPSCSVALGPANAAGPEATGWKTAPKKKKTRGGGKKNKKYPGCFPACCQPLTGEPFASPHSRVDTAHPSTQHGMGDIAVRGPGSEHPSSPVEAGGCPSRSPSSRQPGGMARRQTPDVFLGFGAGFACAAQPAAALPEEPSKAASAEGWGRGREDSWPAPGV